MNISQSFRLAIKSVAASKMRALLTMLGIIIGVAAVIIIVSRATGMQQYMNAQFEQHRVQSRAGGQVYGRRNGLRPHGGARRYVRPGGKISPGTSDSGVTPYVSVQATTVRKRRRRI